MTVRFASFNVENLFARPRALNQTKWEEGEPLLKAFAEFTAESEGSHAGAQLNRQLMDLPYRTGVILSLFTSSNRVRPLDDEGDTHDR
jgi:hypothetical protein